ncbi:MAG: 1-(5-phosphoribosyl)-5-[(5-phosphoribosylamino)methylideneamino]imidazole-4-carboxamide isomerase [Bacteroidetes bacterium]|nr:1-(5-phosphoribosyl)-5-[(5-phosphoribosylamino)methylideneamino]imidazole-4-carboxamide isomerase [Bacteroidota bacterium]MDA0937758.1 1-(5-phosphoribosyl)-5-[(5-phosphoribosylamino)methylideneamino]imidazole-4-carboxamide isomerase [Bacteroidota bacterium]MDA1344276.1 1-(5-phosphoribosyl)-5-[(5-phosphoribosylamino)methylideneamino]imidazole-4-carboxamide isomerase [Bacteroidota bacterium]
MDIIPAIDLIDGKCVRLSQGDYNSKKMYNENPLEVAQAFEAHGIEHLHLVDLDGAKAAHIVNHKVLERLASKTRLKIDFGGGLKSDDDVRIAFESGAAQITGGSIAVKNPTVFESWLRCYGTQKIILGADVRDEKIATNGWTETSDNDLFEFVSSYMQKGVQRVICTDISKDGMLAGPSFSLYQKMIDQLPSIDLVASGGISTLEELPKLKTLGCAGVIIGKALYENRITLKSLEHYILQQ